jgi:hypothetical protein
MSKWAIELGGHEHAGRAEHEFVGRDWCTGSLLLAARFRLQTLISFCSLSSTSCRLRCCVVRHSRWSRFCPFCRFVLGRGTCKDFLCDGAERMCVHEAVNRIPANLTLVYMCGAHVRGEVWWNSANLTLVYIFCTLRSQHMPTGGDSGGLNRGFEAIFTPYLGNDI